MKMNSHVVLGGALLAGLCASASVPTVSNVTSAQDASRRVTVNYTLSGEDGIVTLSVQTNRGDNVWVDVNDDNLSYVSGDVNKVVKTGDHSLVWLPHKSWPDHYITGGNIRIGVKAWAKDAPPDYMVVSLLLSSDVSFYASAGAIPGGVQAYKYKTDYLVLRKIPAASVTWTMGSPSKPMEVSRDSNGTESLHSVTMANDYYIGVYPVTQRQYERIMGTNPSTFKSGADYMTRPVETVSYNTIRGTAGAGYSWPDNGHTVLSTGFLGALRAKTGVNGFDLPTEAQWEFACRAECSSALYNGTELEQTGVDQYKNPINDGTSANLARLARYANNGGKPNGEDPASTCSAANGTACVGSYEPNAWGLYDMLGNVWEICLDWYQASIQFANLDPEVGPKTGESYRTVRGGSWSSPAPDCRSARRIGRETWDIADSKTTGFRVVLCPAAIQ